MGSQFVGMARAPVVRIAMWSGPRNISTALMRAFENRPDCVVVDEPFYAAELAASGRNHPMRAEIIAAGETDPDRVAAALLGPLETTAKPDARLQYQKHMTHHMLPAFDRGWIAHVTSAFLIRDPARVLASYARAWTPESLADIGVPQQAEIFDRVADRLGRAPPVVDAADVLADPRGNLSALCVELDIPFSERMLAWPRGRRASDGIWAPVWYAAVERSTGFAARDTNEVVLPSALARLAEAAQPTYERLSAHRLCPTAAPATPASRSARP